MRYALLLTPVLAVSFVLALPAFASSNWPAWRGPTFDGAAPDAKLPREWSESKNVKWKVKTPGSGLATPIIWGDRIFLQCAIEQGAPVEPPPPQGEGRRRERPEPRPTSFEVLCLSRETGKTLWQTPVASVKPHERIHPDSTYASNSPVTDGERLYAYFGSFGLFCLDFDGKLVWQKDLGDMQTRNEFGEGSSPALHGELVVVNWDHEGESFIVALDKRSGEEKWRTPRNEATSWATPLIVEAAGRTHVVVPGAKAVIGYDLKDGSVIWQDKGLTTNCIPSPVAQDGVVYVMSGFRGHAARAIKLSEAKGDLSGGSAVLWSYDKDTPYVPSPLLYRGQLYFYDNNRPVLTVLDVRSGEKLAGPERIESMRGAYASPVGAGDHVYLVGRDGVTVVLKAGPKFEIIAENRLDDGFDASPAIAGNALFLRGRTHLYCISE